MMVTFVSQCEKNALKKTRRVLDAFADHKALEYMFNEVKAIALAKHDEED